MLMLLQRVEYNDDLGKVSSKYKKSATFYSSFYVNRLLQLNFRSVDHLLRVKLTLLRKFKIANITFLKLQTYTYSLINIRNCPPDSQGWRSLADRL